MKYFCIVIAFSFLLIAGCEKTPDAVPDLSVKQISNDLNYKMNFAGVNKVLMEKYKLKDVKQVERTSDTTEKDFVYSGGKLNGNKIYEWHLMFINDRLCFLWLMIVDRIAPLESAYKDLTTGNNQVFGKAVKDDPFSKKWRIKEGDVTKQEITMSLEQKNKSTIMLAISFWEYNEKALR
jgi:hypothetical protein